MNDAFNNNQKPETKYPGNYQEESNQAWIECQNLFKSMLLSPINHGPSWPEKLYTSEIAVMQTVDMLTVDKSKALQSWRDSLSNKFGSLGKVVSAQESSDYLKSINEAPSRLVAAWFNAFDVEHINNNCDSDDSSNYYDYGVARVEIFRANGTKIKVEKWRYWLGLNSWEPEVATCLLYGIDPDKLPKDKPIVDVIEQQHEQLAKLYRLAEENGSMSPYEWKLFAMDNKFFIPKPIFDIKKSQNPQAETTEQKPEVMENDGKKLDETKLEVSAPAGGDNKRTGTGRRNDQVEFICATAKQLKYDLLNIPEKGKPAIKAECLKNKGLFTDSGFGHAWKEANKRKVISMKDKEKYLSNQ